MSTEENSKETIRILIVEDHKILAESYGNILAGQAGVTVVGHVITRQDAIDVLNSNSNIDLVLMDLFLGEEEDHEEPEGLKTCREIKTGTRREVKILIVTSEIEGKWIWKAYDMGVEGYMPKKEGSEKLMEAIRHLALGKRFYKDEVEDARDRFHSTLTNLEEEIVPLTKTETEILEMTAKGLTAIDIAKIRNCVVGTVDIHKNHIFKKLGAANAPEAVRIAMEKEIILKS